MQMVEWKIKGLYKADAEKVFNEITSIGEEVTPQEVVDYARDKDTELHKCFEWKDRVAAEKYRLHQARAVMQNIITVVAYKGDDDTDKSVTVRAIVSTNKYETKYETVTRAIENPESFARIQTSMLKDIQIFKQRYEKYASLKSEYIELFDAIDAAIG